MTIEEKRRELFEAWWNTEQYCGCVSDMWLGFNAALDSVVIELPARYVITEHTYSYQRPKPKHHGYNTALRDCKALIEATGLGIKVV